MSPRRHNNVGTRKVAVVVARPIPRNRGRTEGRWISGEPIDSGRVIARSNVNQSRSERIYMTHRAGADECLRRELQPQLVEDEDHTTTSNYGRKASREGGIQSVPSKIREASPTRPASELKTDLVSANSRTAPDVVGRFNDRGVLHGLCHELQRRLASQVHAG